MTLKVIFRKLYDNTLVAKGEETPYNLEVSCK